MATITVDELNAAVWGTLERIAGKEFRREMLSGGSEYDVEVELIARLHGKEFTRFVSATTRVAEDSERASSKGPDTGHLVAHLLSRLPKTQRERLLRELPEQFAAAENRLPEVDAALLEGAKNLLDRLRAKVVQAAKGSVSTAYRFLPAK